MDQTGQVAFLIDNAMPYSFNGEAKQNFGYLLANFFCERLFVGVGPRPEVTRVVGSAFDDGVLAREIDNDLSLTGPRTTKTVFWGCGLRHETSFSESARELSTILSVRGPLSRSALGLGVGIPIGDPALLLPFLHSPRQDAAFTGKKVLVPRFNDMRGDAELLSLSGCEVVLRHEISWSISAIEEFIDRLTSAKFVLAGELHGAIVAAAYGTPFAYWDTGEIDIPFTWRDFSASVGITCKFHTTVNAGENYYDAEIRRALELPPLFPMLLVAPLPVRQDPLVRVIRADIDRNGIDSLRNRCRTSLQTAPRAETCAVVELLVSAVLELKQLKVKTTEVEQKLNADFRRLEAKHADTERLLSDAILACDVALRKFKQAEASATANWRAAEEATARAAEEATARAAAEAAAEAAARAAEEAAARAAGEAAARAAGEAVARAAEEKQRIVSLLGYDPTNIEPRKERSSFGSFKQSIIAIGYLVAPFGKRRRSKRNKLIAALRGC